MKEEYTLNGNETVKIPEIDFNQVEDFTDTVFRENIENYIKSLENFLGSNIFLEERLESYNELQRIINKLDDQIQKIKKEIKTIEEKYMLEVEDKNKVFRKKEAIKSIEESIERLEVFAGKIKKIETASVQAPELVVEKTLEIIEGTLENKKEGVSKEDSLDFNDDPSDLFLDLDGEEEYIPFDTDDFLGNFSDKEDNSEVYRTKEPTLKEKEKIMNQLDLIRFPSQHRFLEIDIEEQETKNIDRSMTDEITAEEIEKQASLLIRRRIISQKQKKKLLSRRDRKNRKLITVLEQLPEVLFSYLLQEKLLLSMEKGEVQIISKTWFKKTIYSSGSLETLQSRIEKIIIPEKLERKKVSTTGLKKIQKLEEIAKQIEVDEIITIEGEDKNTFINTLIEDFVTLDDTSLSENGGFSFNEKTQKLSFVIDQEIELLHDREEYISFAYCNTQEEIESTFELFIDKLKDEY